ncbi:putative Stigma-specific Stig1 family protein [Melia azedarach]|uniref:Stigma-specific Stig1 family protein n=1 Tax=Melia azedarach TaxID=155640 RepID=A0ACC1YMW0_MELAZ|nr:putative Stigma-specific Stig1 family protein [Melia azedarach]
MKSTKPFLIFLLFTLFLLLHNIVSATPNVEEENINFNNSNVGIDLYEADEDQDDGSLMGTSGRSLLQKRRNRHYRTLRLTCKKFPRICYFKGSPGHSCCKKKCVNLLKDRMNCGKCGKKCKYNQICCNGKCVNPSFNGRHCGACNNSCNNGEFCVFGLCNYA